MVQGVGGAGSSGSIQNLVEYQVYYPMYQQYNKDNDCNLSFEAYLTLKGYIKHFNQKVENYLETGNNNISDGKDGNTISDGRRIAGGNTSIYQSEDEESCYEFDYEKGTYRIIQGKEEVAKALGLSPDTNVDRIKFGAGSVQIYDYTFGGLDDGQDSQNFGVNGRFGNVSLTKQEFDMDYILNALLMDPSDPQYNIAKQIFDDLCSSVSQWLPASELEALNKIAKESGTNSAEYKAALKEALRLNLDQAQEWVDDHTHVKNTGGASLTPENPDGVDKPGTGDDSGSETGKAPEFDKNTVIDNAGLLADYTSNKKWKGEAFSLKGRSSDEARDLAIANATQHASEILTNLENSLIQQLGEGCTDEIRKYITKAKAATLADRSWLETDFDGGMLRKNRHQTGFVKNQALINKFFNEFNTLCANKGKTSAEVEADKKAAEAKKAKETEAFKTLYNMNMKSTAQEAGVDPNKDIQVVNAASAAVIQSKAESQILVPLKAKIKEKLAGKGMSDADINTILENSAKAALSNCTDWSTTDNNFVYTIDTDKLIAKFESNIKTMVKNKGYNF